MSQSNHSDSQPAGGSRYPWKVLAVVMIGTLMAALDSSIVNVSLPAIMADFGSSLDDIEWVITGYMLAFATLMPLTSWFRDRIGHKALYIGSLAVFTAGSVLCAISWSLPTLVFARVLQALGGGAVTPTGMAMISEVFAPKDRAKALGYWGMGVLIGPAFGPTLGGWLTKVFGWPSIFMVNLPIGLIGVFLGLSWLLPDRPSDRPTEGQRPLEQLGEQLKKNTTFDTWGFLSLSVFLISFLLGVSKGEHEGWTSTYIFVCGVLSVVGFLGFLVAESIVPNAIVDLNLLKYRVFLGCLIVTVMRSLALYGGVFLLPLYLEQLRGLDEVASGLILLPGSLVIGIMMPLSSPLLTRFGPRLLTIAGLIGVTLFLYMYRDIDSNTSTWQIILPTLVRGVGIGLLFTPVTATALNHVPKHKAAMASSLLNLVQQVGGSVGIAALAVVMTRRVKFHMASFGSLIDAKSPAFGQAMHRVAEHAHALGYTHAESRMIGFMQVAGAVGTSATAAAFQDSFLFAAFLVGVSTLASFLLPNSAELPSAEHLLAME